MHLQRKKPTAAQLNEIQTTSPSWREQALTFEAQAEEKADIVEKIRCLQRALKLYDRHQSENFINVSLNMVRLLNTLADLNQTLWFNQKKTAQCREEAHSRFQVVNSYLLEETDRTEKDLRQVAITAATFSLSPFSNIDLHKYSMTHQAMLHSGSLTIALNYLLNLRNIQASFSTEVLRQVTLLIYQYQPGACLNILETSRKREEEASRLTIVLASASVKAFATFLKLGYKPSHDLIENSPIFPHTNEPENPEHYQDIWKIGAHPDFLESFSKTDIEEFILHNDSALIETKLCFAFYRAALELNIPSVTSAMKINRDISIELHYGLLITALMQNPKARFSQITLEQVMKWLQFILRDDLKLAKRDFETFKALRQKEGFNSNYFNPDEPIDFLIKGLIEFYLIDDIVIAEQNFISTSKKCLRHQRDIKVVANIYLAKIALLKNDIIKATLYIKDDIFTYLFNTFANGAFKSFIISNIKLISSNTTLASYLIVNGHLSFSGYLHYAKNSEEDVRLVLIDCLSQDGFVFQKQAIEEIDSKIKHYSEDIAQSISGIDLPEAEATVKHAMAILLLRIVAIKRDFETAVRTQETLSKADIEESEHLPFLAQEYSANYLIKQAFLYFNDAIETYSSIGKETLANQIELEVAHAKMAFNDVITDALILPYGIKKQYPEPKKGAKEKETYYIKTIPPYITLALRQVMSDMDTDKKYRTRTDFKKYLLILTGIVDADEVLFAIIRQLKKELINLIPKLETGYRQVLKDFIINRIIVYVKTSRCDLSLTIREFKHLLFKSDELAYALLERAITDSSLIQLFHDKSDPEVGRERLIELQDGCPDLSQALFSIVQRISPSIDYYQPLHPIAFCNMSQIGYSATDITRMAKQGFFTATETNFTSFVLAVLSTPTVSQAGASSDFFKTYDLDKTATVLELAETFNIQFSIESAIVFCTRLKSVFGPEHFDQLSQKLIKTESILDSDFSPR